MKAKDVIGGVSATYRKAVNRVAKALRVDPDHTRYPSEDLETIADLIDEKSKERALKWYRLGLRRGFIEACDAVLEGELELKESTLFCPQEVIISVRIRFKGGPQEDRDFSFTAKELGFK